MALSAGQPSPRITNSFIPPGDEILNSTTLTISDLYEWSAANNPDHPVFLYHDGKGHQYISYSTTVLAINRATRYTLSCTGPYRGPSSGRRPVIAIFANTGE